MCTAFTKFYRIIAQVWVNGTDVNAAMRRFLNQ